jgi:hypothetical protein
MANISTGSRFVYFNIIININNYLDVLENFNELHNDVLNLADNFFLHITKQKKIACTLLIVSEIEEYADSFHVF